MTATEDAAVAVVGGGVAGAAACLALSRASQASTRPVLWIAPDAGGNGDRVGESLAPAAGPILNRLGLDGLLDDARHRRSNASFSAWGTDRLVERNAVVHLEGPGWVLDRDRFERDLRAAAGRWTDRRPASVAAAVARAGRWHLSLSDGTEASARFLVDATGRAAAVSRTLADRLRDDRMIAACAFLPQRDPGVEPTPATLIEAVPGGWWYASLLPDGRLSVAFFSDPDLIPRGLSRSCDLWRSLIAGTVQIAHWIADAGFAVEAPPRLESAGTTWLNMAAGTSHGAGWAAVGDAAAAFDPLSSHGMTTALWAAARIADVVPPWLAEGDESGLDGYARAVTDGVAQFRQQRAAFYARERRFADAPFWRRRSRTPS